MRRILLCFGILFTSLLKLSGQDNTVKNEIGFRNYFSESNFGRRNFDTIYYISEEGRKIHKIKQDTLVFQYFPSGNLLGEGFVRKANCEEYINEHNIVTEMCSYILDGKWVIYFDSAVKIKQAEIYFIHSVC